MGRPAKYNSVIQKFFKLDAATTGKCVSFKCNFCSTNFAKNYVRQVKHLMKCKDALKCAKFTNEKEGICKLLKISTRENDENLNIYDDNVEDEMDINLSTDVWSADQPSTSKSRTSTATSSTSAITHNPTQIDNCFDRKFNKKEQDAIWKLLARACYATGTPFSFTENEYWQAAFKKIRPCLNLPTRYQVSTSLLDAEYERVNESVKKKIHSAKFMCLQLDGWTNIRYEPIINVVLTTPTPVIFKIIDAGTNQNTGDYMASIILEVLKEVRRESIMSVVTDNAANLKRSCEIVNRDMAQKIPFYGCCAHILNLLIKDIMKLKPFDQIQSSSMKVIKAVKNTEIINALFKQYQHEQSETAIISLKLPVAVRWASIVTSLESLIVNKYVLQRLAISEEGTNLLSKKVVEYIWDNDIFWNRIKTVIELLSPVLHWITKLESNKCLLSDVHLAFNELKEIFESNLSKITEIKSEISTISKCLDDRKTMAITDIHKAAHLLDPRAKGKYLTPIDSIDAVSFVSNLARWMSSFDNDVTEVDVLSDLALFRSSEGLWAHEFVWNSLKIRSDKTCIDAVAWWKGVCDSTSLSKIAAAILQCPPTSSATERSVSTYGLIHTAKRNLLTNERASKLVFIKQNLNLCKGTPGIRNLSTMCQFQNESLSDIPEPEIVFSDSDSDSDSDG